MSLQQTALVLGLGDSGEAAVELLLNEQIEPVLLDRGDTEVLRRRAEALRRRGARVVLGATALPEGTADLCIVSPGIPETAPWVVEARRRGSRVVSELEFGWSRRRASTRVVALTGSNGKSTAVKWLTESLQAAGLRAQAAGNYGLPVSRLVLEHPEQDWLVLEVSSFQLETVADFRPDVGILLNILPNHLDRHGTLQRYRELKARLFQHVGAEGVCLAPPELLDDLRTLSGGQGAWRSFGTAGACDYRYEKGQILRGRDVVLRLEGTRFDNEILGVAGAAVAGAREACGVAPACAEKAAQSFVPLPHRMQVVRTLRGVTFVNDSKATNLSALSAALRMTPGRVRVIAGGLVKENDFGLVKELLARKAEGVYLIGKAAEAMESAWSEVVPCWRCGELASAALKAWKDSKPGETILLSPACASFDQFRNYEDRGEQFVKWVEQLP